MPSEFIIRRPYPGYRKSILIPFATVRGKAIMVDPVDPTQGKLAEGALAGFVTRDVAEGGPSVIDRAQVFPGRLELPFSKDQECTLELADAVECEGDEYIVQAGADAITAATPINTKLSFVDGKFRVSQAGDIDYFLLTKLPTPELDPVNTRIYAERII